MAGNKNVANRIDAHVGSRVRTRRILKGLSQERLGEALGLTFQQVQKYERGANRIGASRLFDIAQVLDVPISYFFDDMPPDVRAIAAPPELAPGTVRMASLDTDIMLNRETVDLVHTYYGIYYGIPSAETRRRMLDLLRAVARHGPDINEGESGPDDIEETRSGRHFDEAF